MNRLGEGVTSGELQNALDDSIGGSKTVVTDGENGGMDIEFSETRHIYHINQGVAAFAGMAAIIATITFLVDGVQFGDTISSSVIATPTQLPTKSGTEFTGWYYDENGTRPAIKGESIETPEITLYAGWGTTTKMNISYNHGSTIQLWQGQKGVVYDSATTYTVSDTSFKHFNMYNNKKVSAVLLGKFNHSENPVRSFEVIENNLSVTVAYASSGTNYKTANPEDINVTFEDGKLIVVSDVNNNEYVSNISGKLKIRVVYEDGTVEVLTLTYSTYVSYQIGCFVEGTNITLADGTRKKIEDITYDDKLLVWNFDEGKLDAAEPLWIMKKSTEMYYTKLEFDNGVELKVVEHRIFNMDDQQFSRADLDEELPIGTTVFMEDGTTAKLINKTNIHDQINIYNIITYYHLNVFAEGVLTSNKFNNLYKIENMKFIKDDRELNLRGMFASIPDEYFDGLRLAEQKNTFGNDGKTLEEKILTRIINMKKESA